jgi:hypothetical protein
MLRTAFLLFATLCLAATEKDSIKALVQKTFDAMAAKDAAAIEACFTREAQLIAIRDTGESSTTSVKDFAQRISSSKSKLLERMWNPEVRISGRLATLWAPYDFHRDGKRTHCGIDQVDLVQTPEGWRIASLIYTIETKDCPASPLGPVN